MVIFSLPTRIGEENLIGELGFTDLNKLDWSHEVCHCKEDVKFDKTANNFGSTYDVREVLCAARPNERERDDESHWVIHAVKRPSNTVHFPVLILKRSLSKQTVIHVWA